ncbi:acetyltransferase (GNAT) family protein [Salana multivorans]|uniref:Acetyltransferase (GNAT) family protein n=1 Tax=Salana multivorans TaxID=120377 RepID=A0A3N2DBU8_9MICO|nr:acetyltransferase (GNAT) family protein [Salana multivorans]
MDRAAVGGQADGVTTTVLEAPPVPPSPDHPDVWAYAGYNRLTRDLEVELLGHSDRWAPLPISLAFLTDSDWQRSILLVAVRDGVAEPGADDVVGAAEVRIPLRDNLRTGHVFVVVDERVRGAGIGTALLERAEAWLRAQGRDHVIGWSTVAPEPEPGPGTLEAPTGAGRVPSDDPTVAFLLGRGYRLEQVARASQLDVPRDADEPRRHAALAAAAAGADYRVLHLDAAAAQDHLDALARLHTRMSTDVPLADLRVEEEVWDAERVAEYVADYERSWQEMRLAVVEHVPTGELVAYTELQIPAFPEIEFGFQRDTLVLREHRGHRLGMLAKAANLELLVRERPCVRRIHTQNASENEHMLAINVALGFRTVAVQAGWQKGLGAV